MRFVDEVVIEVAAGDGGRGCVSFLRQRYMPKGGPDGGDGGRGGHVILKADGQMATLADYRYLRHINAGRGGHGQGANKTGAGGQDKIIAVPVGTVVYNNETNQMLADLTEPDQEVILAQGGRGGKGNRHFVSSTHRAPRFAQPGEPGEQFSIRLELKLLAQVGLIGLPNAGKSSLVRALTAARPKVGDYPFTTLTPHLGVASLPDERTITLADIPGLVEGAHQGAGLGLKFLRHVERTKVFLLVLDMSAEDPLSDLQTVLAEVGAYDAALLKRPLLLAANKMDLPQAEANLASLRGFSGHKNYTIYPVSAEQKTGLSVLLAGLGQALPEEETQDKEDDQPWQ